MKSGVKDSAIDRRQFLAASGGVFAAAVPGDGMLSRASDSISPSASLDPKPAGTLRKIPLGVFDPAYKDLSLDAMLTKSRPLAWKLWKSAPAATPKIVIVRSTN